MVPTPHTPAPLPHMPPCHVCALPPSMHAAPKSAITVFTDMLQVLRSWAHHSGCRLCQGSHRSGKILKTFSSQGKTGGFQPKSGEKFKIRENFQKWVDRLKVGEMYLAFGVAMGEVLLFTIRKGSCRKVMFSQACQEFCPRGGGGGCPGPGPGRGSAQGVSRPRPGEVPRPRGVCIPACTEADTPICPPADGYCCGRYASYWNAFLWEVYL